MSIVAKTGRRTQISANFCMSQAPLVKSCQHSAVSFQLFSSTGGQLFFHHPITGAQRKLKAEG
jgi:hypothetical protein